MNEYIVSLDGELGMALAVACAGAGFAHEEIVRCMDCKYILLNKDTFHRCWKLGHNVYDLHKFCAWGERKEFE